MKITFNSPLILTFSFICVVVYIITIPLGYFPQNFVLQPNWGNGDFSSYFRLISHIIGHANMEHLIGNLSFILLIGPIVEKQYGSKILLAMILTTALVTSILHMFFFENGLLGASGIVFMLIILTSMVNIKNGEIPITFILIVFIYIGKEVIDSFDNDNISHFAHIIGGLVGAVFGFILAGKKSPQETKAKDILTGL
jgi:GlpG protein